MSLNVPNEGGDFVAQKDSNNPLQSVSDELDVLDQEFQRLEEAHRNYNKSLNDLQKYQNECLKEVKHQKYRLKQIRDGLKRFAMALNLFA